MATYDPYKLVEQVRKLGQASGAEIQPTDERMALTTRGRTGRPRTGVLHAH